MEPNKKAFTLIELIVVIFIIGLASAVVGGSLYRNMDDIRLKTAAKEIAATLRYARSRSVAEKKVYSFIADVKGYGLYTDHSDSGLKTGQEKHAYSLYKYYPEGIDIENREKEETVIDFFPEGDSTGGSIILKNRKATSYVISVDKIQSSVKIQ
ncbi:MAG: GspH/FimT family pseudopilin [Proteobacteria bacterium]|nr:GspH/FimT family pseudopilin [Pseudomonadota bacterium]